MKVGIVGNDERGVFTVSVLRHEIPEFSAVVSPFRGSWAGWGIISTLQPDMSPAEQTLLKKIADILAAAAAELPA